MLVKMEEAKKARLKFKSGALSGDATRFRNRWGRNDRIQNRLGPTI